MPADLHMEHCNKEAKQDISAARGWFLSQNFTIWLPFRKCVGKSGGEGRAHQTPKKSHRTTAFPQVLWKVRNQLKGLCHNLNLSVARAPTSNSTRDTVMLGGKTRWRRDLKQCRFDSKCHNVWPSFISEITGQCSRIHKEATGACRKGLVIGKHSSASMGPATKVSPKALQGYGQLHQGDFLQGTDFMTANFWTSINSYQFIKLRTVHIAAIYVSTGILFL